MGVAGSEGLHTGEQGAQVDGEGQGALRARGRTVLPCEGDHLLLPRSRGLHLDVDVCCAAGNPEREQFLPERAPAVLAPDITARHDDRQVPGSRTRQKCDCKQHREPARGMPHIAKILLKSSLLTSGYIRSIRISAISCPVWWPLSASPRAVVEVPSGGTASQAHACELAAGRRGGYAGKGANLPWQPESLPAISPKR